MAHKIKLTEAQVRMCDKMGISPKMYAKYLLDDIKRRRNRNNRRHNITKG
jgi:hypothetical protein